MTTPSLVPLVAEWRAKAIYHTELCELLEVGELTPQMAHFIDWQCSQLRARCLAIQTTVAQVKSVADERPERLDILCYASYPHLLPRVSRINELLEILDQLRGVILMLIYTSETEIELAIHERYAALSQELEYQRRTLLAEIDDLPDDDDEFDDESWRGDDDDSDLLDDDSDDDDLFDDDDLMEATGDE